MTDPTPAADHVLAVLDDIHFATIATLDPDGSPRQAVVWYTLDGTDIILNSAVGRRWPANLQRDPRVAVAIADRHDGYRWIGFNGRVSAVIEDQPTAQADIAGMARRYHADEPEEAEALIRSRFERQTRISFRVPLADVHDHLD
jgi:PPOX class probable F420-dependent enzyme